MSTPTPPSDQQPNRPQWQQPQMPPPPGARQGPPPPHQGAPQPPYPGSPQPPYGQHPGSVMLAPPPPPKKKHGAGFWILIGVLVIIALIFVSCTAALVGGSSGGSAVPATSSTSAATTASDEPSSEPSQAPTKKAPPKSEGATTAEIGDTVKAGDWQFKVTDFDCGHTSVGDSYLNKKAQGQFCFLKITAKNNGDDEGLLDGSSQKLTDDDGKSYSSDTEAALYEDPQDTLFLKGVNPGNTAKGLIVFDVPKSVKITQVSLTGGLFDGKATVSLR